MESHDHEFAGIPAGVDASAQAVVDAWNLRHRPGTKIRYWIGPRIGPGRPGTTRTEAHLIASRPMVFIGERHDAVALANVEPVNGQVAEFVDPPAPTGRRRMPEPPNTAMVAMLEGADGEEAVTEVYVRDDASTTEADYDPDERWFAVGYDAEHPSTWASLTRNGAKMERLYLESQLPVPPGVTVRLEWGVHSIDGQVYTVDGGEEAAIREAALLYRGVPGDPELTPEPGCAPASRYVMVTPHGLVEGGWRWPLSWQPSAEER